jgi:hypothetical protein
MTENQPNAVPAKTPEQIYKNRIQKMNDRQLLRESKRLQKAHAGKFPRINEAFATVFAVVLEAKIAKRA